MIHGVRHPPGEAMRKRARGYRVRVFQRWMALRFGPLGLHGVVLVALYATFMILAYLLSFGRVQPGRALIAGVILAGLLFLSIIAALMSALWRALCDTSGRVLPGTLRQVLLFTAVAGLILVFLPRLFSKDVLSYIMYGRAFGAYGLNPYTTDPVNVQFDYNFRLIDWHYAGSVYGPVWTLLCTALYKLLAPLVTTHIWGYIVGFRLLALAFHLGNAVLIWRILGRIRPRQQVAGTLFYAWNPLALIEFAGNTHNDVALLFFLLAAILAALHERLVLTALFLALSVLTKFITLLVLPAYLLVLWRQSGGGRRGLRALGLTALTGAVSFVVFWAPFRDALRHPLFLISSSAASAYDNSLLEVAYWGLRHLLGAFLPPARGNELANMLVKASGRLAFLAIWLVLTWRSRDIRSWLDGAFWMLFAYLFLAAPWFWPWYVSWLVALAPLSGGRRATAATFTFSGSALIIYLLWGNQLPFDRASLYPVHNIVAFGIPLVALWLQLRRPGAGREPIYANAKSPRLRTASSDA